MRMWRGKTKMKKLIILITAMFIILLTSACGKVENTESSVVITDADAKYIELVYDNIENYCRYQCLYHGACGF